MIAHVAAAGERRGRVVLSLTSGHVNALAIEAALRVAQAFESELESLFIEDNQLFEVASYDFAREISLSGRHTEPLSAEAMSRQLRHVFAALSRQVDAAARRAEIPLRQTVVRGEAVVEVARACESCGPWNVVALGEPLSDSSGDRLRAIFETVRDTTGVVAVGPRVRACHGPVVVAVEDLTHLEPMLKAARRMMAVLATEVITVLLIGVDQAAAHDLEGQARLLLGDTPEATIVSATARHGLAVEVAEILRRTPAGFILAQFGGLVVPSDRELRHLLASLECPLFLLR